MSKVFNEVSTLLKTLSKAEKESAQDIMNLTAAQRDLMASSGGPARDTATGPGILTKHFTTALHSTQETFDLVAAAAIAVSNAIAAKERKLAGSGGQSRSRTSNVISKLAGESSLDMWCGP